ncbi:MAG: thioredoxin family protein [Kofleriaceae bacterium]|nr:thioredoxin family protein [Kofleriaceae bacterium]
MLTLVFSYSCSSKGKDKKADESQEDKPPQVATAQAKDASLGEDSAIKDIQPLPKIELPWKSSLPEAILESKQSNKYVFIDFTASWCKACKELDMTTFRDPEVAGLLKSDFILVKLDVTEQSTSDKKLMQKYGVAKLPALLANQGEAVYLQINRLIGPRDLLSHLKNLPAIVPAATTD